MWTWKHANKFIKQIIYKSTVISRYLLVIDNVKIHIIY